MFAAQLFKLYHASLPLLLLALCMYLEVSSPLTAYLALGNPDDFDHLCTACFLTSGGLLGRQPNAQCWNRDLGAKIRSNGMSSMGEEQTFLYPLGSFGWSNNQIDMR